MLFPLEKKNLKVVIDVWWLCTCVYKATHVTYGYGDSMYLMNLLWQCSFRFSEYFVKVSLQKAVTLSLHLHVTILLLVIFSHTCCSFLLDFVTVQILWSIQPWHDFSPVLFLSLWML